MKNILLAIICLLPQLKLFAQDSTENYMNRVNYIFANVNHNRVETGLLADYGLQVIPPEYYNGVLADSNEVDINIWRVLYSGMQSSKFNNLCTLPNDSIVNSVINQNMPAAGQPIPIAIQFIKYNKLRDDAYTAGLINVVNDQLQDIPGKNPYETAFLFAATPFNS